MSFRWSREESRRIQSSSTLILDRNPNKVDRDKDLRLRINQEESLEIEIIIETETIARKTLEMTESHESRESPGSKEISTLTQIRTIGYTIWTTPNFTKWWLKKKKLLTNSKSICSWMVKTYCQIEKSQLRWWKNLILLEPAISKIQLWWKTEMNTTKMIKSGLCSLSTKKNKLFKHIDSLWTITKTFKTGPKMIS